MNKEEEEEQKVEMKVAQMKSLGETEVKSVHYSLLMHSPEL